MNKNSVLNLLLTLALVFPVIANSASFDCTKAGTRIEKLICKDDDLSLMDELLLKNYKEYLNSSSADNKSDIKKQQRLWLKERNSSCDSLYQCIATYADRVKSIKKYTDTNTLIKELKTIKNANQLIWKNSFKNLRSDYFEGHRSKLVSRKAGLTSSEFRELMSGTPQAYSDARDFITAMSCRHHSCDEKGVVAIDKINGQLIFAALHFIDENGSTNINRPTLTFFYKNKSFLDITKPSIIEMVKDIAKIELITEVKLN